MQTSASLVGTEAYQDSQWTFSSRQRQPSRFLLSDTSPPCDPAGCNIFTPSLTLSAGLTIPVSTVQAIAAGTAGVGHSGGARRSDGARRRVG